LKESGQRVVIGVELDQHALQEVNRLVQHFATDLIPVAALTANQRQVNHLRSTRHSSCLPIPSYETSGA
jgi:hypothetical protein